MKKNVLITIVFGFVIVLFCLGCVSGGRSTADAYLDNAGIPLGKPFKDVDSDGIRYVWLTEGVTPKDFADAKYLVVRLYEMPTAGITIAWSGQIDGADFWWNPKAFNYQSPGVEWKSDEKQLWIELSKILADYDRYIASSVTTKLFFPSWGTGDGGAFGDDYIIAGWLMK